MSRSCRECSSVLPVAGRGRIPTFCSTACRMRAHRRSKDVLPTEMRTAARWVCRAGKRPIMPTGRSASSTDPATWSTYLEARKGSGDGYGFVLGDGFACIDLDHCLIDGKISALAAEVLDLVPAAYVEISPSGDGLHVLGYLDGTVGRRLAIPAIGGELSSSQESSSFEVYNWGRYVTVTENVYRRGSLVDLTPVVERYAPDQQDRRARVLAYEDTMACGTQAVI